MFQSSQNEYLINLANSVVKRINLFEGIIAFLFAILITLKITTGMQVNVVILLILSLLAFLYFMNAFSAEDNEVISPLVIFAKKVISWGASVSVVSIMFGMMNWPGWDVQLNVGLSSIIFAMVFGLILKSRNNVVSFISFRWVLRIIVLAALCAVLKFADHNELIRMGVMNKSQINNVK
jgi:hypothetical protein